MNEFYLLSAGLCGLLLGSLFFGGLWWTVKKCMTARNPALWFLGSAVVRMSLVITGFYYVGGGEWQRLLACLLGFVIARFIVIRMTQEDVVPADASIQEANHAA